MGRAIVVAEDNASSIFTDVARLEKVVKLLLLLSLQRERFILVSAPRPSGKLNGERKLEILEADGVELGVESEVMVND